MRGPGLVEPDLVVVRPVWFLPSAKQSSIVMLARDLVSGLAGLCSRAGCLILKDLQYRAAGRVLAVAR